MNEEVLDLIMVELELQGLNDEIYRYHLACGLTVVYYMPDYEKLKEGVFEPIYMKEEDLEEMNLTEKEMFERVYWNTVMISQPEILLFTDYMKELIPKCDDERMKKILYILSENLSAKCDDEKLWCITNSFREKGAFAGIFIPLLRKFCMVHGKKKVLLGFANNDFVFMYADSVENENVIFFLTYELHHILKEADEIAKCMILQYDYEMNILTKCIENGSI